MIAFSSRAGDSCYKLAAPGSAGGFYDPELIGASYFKTPGIAAGCQRVGNAERASILAVSDLAAKARVRGESASFSSRKIRRRSVPVPAQTKRRRLSLYSLPVVVAIGFLLVAKLAAWQQSDIVADLADRIAHGESREASDAVRKLAAMPNPPVSILVTAAAADEHQTADAGQVAINKLLRRWQRDVERNHRAGAIASQLCELAEALDTQQRDFASSDHQWLAITAGKILRLANALPAAKTPLVAIHCDAILAAVDAGGSISVSGSVDDESAGAPKTSETTSTPVSTAATSKEHGPAPTVLNHEVSLSPPQTIGANPPLDRPTDSVFNLEDDTANALHENQPGDDVDHHGDEPIEGGLSAGTLSPPNRFNDAEWSRPILRILPSKTEDVAPADKIAINEGGKELVAESPRSAAPSLHAAAHDELREVDTKVLLRSWSRAEGDEILSIERELARRGFGKVTPGLVQQFFSDKAEDRMRLVDGVLAKPHGGAGAWLLLLADDPDADVRLFAVTLMATSNNASLVDKAWQVALRDHDPRIADLAGRLRERRAGTLRR